MARLSYATQAAAQAVANRIFADMQKTGALEPLTTAWAIPYQDKDIDGNVLAPDWFVTVNERCADFMASDELASVPELQRGAA